MPRSFRANDCSHIWAESDYIELNAAIDYWCEGDPRCRLAKEQAILSSCEKKMIRWARADGKDFADPVRELATRNLVLIERKSFETWAAALDEKIQLPQSMSTREANGLRSQVAALAMLLAKQNRRYMKEDGNPSANAIATDLLEMLDESDQIRGKEGERPANRAGVSLTSVRVAISEGARQLFE
ncbi:MAG: hypothetical protein ACE5FN_09790 [Leptospirillia bacterium]